MKRESRESIVETPVRWLIPNLSAHAAEVLVSHWPPGRGRSNSIYTRFHPHSLTIESGARLQHLLKRFPRGILAVERDRPCELFWVDLFGFFANARKHGVPILRKTA
jgi:hypothetical protein